MKKLILLFLYSVFVGASAIAGTVVKDKTFIDDSFKGVKTVKIVQSVLDVNIVRSTTGKTSVKCHVKELDMSGADRYAVEARMVGTTLEIYQRPDSDRKGFVCRKADGTIDIAVAEGVRVVAVSAVSGDVSVRDCSLDNLSIKSVSGDLSLENVVAELAVVSTTSGDVTIGSSKGNKITVNTVSGDVVAKGKNFGVDFSLVSLSSTSGDLSVYVGPNVRETAFKSVSGDIRLYFKGDLKRNAYSLGGVSSKISISGYVKGERELHIRPENPVVDVRVNAVSGDICIANY